MIPLWLVCAQAQAAEVLRLESSLNAMGSTYTIVAFGEERQRLEAAVEHGFDEIRRLDELLSNYKPHSEWSRVNRQAAQNAVRVSPELFRLLEACETYSRSSDGAFDITVGPLVKVWGFYKGSGRLPHRAEIRGALARVGYGNVILDRDNSTVKFAREGMEIDPGGIGKGYAVDRVVALLRQDGVGAALVSAGGSSIYGLGAPPNEPRGWKVQIRHPRQPSGHVAELWLRDGSMATSGTSEKFFTVGGKTYSHIFDPRSGYPAQGMLSVTVTAPEAIDSEAWTKPLFILGRSWARKKLPGQFKAFFCEDRLRLACDWLQ